VELLRKLGDRFDQIVLITHIESVRDGVDHLIAVRYDETTGASAVDQSQPQPTLPFGNNDVAAD
jgi:exonuclease SbcC